MKRLLSWDRERPCFLLVGILLLLSSDVTTYDGACPGGKEGALDSKMLEVVMSWMPEELKNPDDICMSRLGAGSSLCRDAYAGNYSGICGNVWCRSPRLDICTAFSSYDGIKCGHNKWCYDGICQYSEYAVAGQDYCPFGDNMEFTRDGLSCDHLVSRDWKRCYDDIVQQMCCGSCTVARVNQAGCEYGDRMTGCQGNECAFMTQDELSMCCETCAYYRIVIPTQRPEVSVSPPLTVVIRTGTTGETTTGTKTIHVTSMSSTSKPSSPVPTKTTSSIESTVAKTGSLPTPKTEITSTPETTNHSTLESETAASSNLKTTVKTEMEYSSTTPHRPPLPTTLQLKTTPSQTVKAADTRSSVEGTTLNPGNVDGQVDAQQDTQNAVAIGTGVGIGSLVVIVVVVITVYAIRKQMTPQGMLSPLEERGLDDHSVGEESTASLSTGMLGSSSRWFPSYRATHSLE